jgi:ABC-2 type transport system permease protein
MLIATGIYVLGLKISLFSILMLVPMMAIGAIGYVFFSFCISAMSKTEGNISIITNILTLPLMLCSSAFYSLTNAPLWIQKISHYNPFQWFVNGLRSSLLLDWQLYFTSLLLLCLCCAVALILAITTFKYRES